MKRPRRTASSGLAMAAVGLVVWLIHAGSTVRDLRTFQWSSSLLLLAAFVIVPMVAVLVRDDEDEVLIPGRILRGAYRMQFPSAVLLLVACVMTAGPVATLVAAPWFVVTALLATAGAVRLLRRGVLPAWKLCRDVALIFTVVGGVWTLADRGNIHPLGFGADIVQLTAVHFHYAGLALPVVTACVLRRFPESFFGMLAGFGVVAGVPLVAVGITAAQLGIGTLAELLAAVVLVPCAMTIAVCQLVIARREGSTLLRGLFAVSALSLMLGMVLALFYAARGVIDVPWLNIPWMRALHGTANAIGFGVCGVSAWYLDDMRRRKIGA